MKAEIRQLLVKTTVVGSEILYFEELDSTNTYLKRAVQESAVNGTVVIADRQTAGRGRMERTFQSPAGKGIYLSVLLRPDLPADRLLPVTALAGIAVCDAVERVCGIRPGLKWPNDLVLNGKKLCGILTELVMDPQGSPCVILGIGINVSQTKSDFTPEVAEIATSLVMELGEEVSCPVLTAALIEALDRLYATLYADDLSKAVAVYRRDCVNLWKAVQLIGMNGTRENAVAVDVDEAFGLVVRTDDGARKTVRSGEVSVRGLYGYLE